MKIQAVSKTGRGLETTAKFAYNSWVWFPAISGSTKSWQPVANWGLDLTAPLIGYLTFIQTQQVCTPGNVSEIFSNFVYHDAFGTAHPFAGQSFYTAVGSCLPPQSLNSTATDGSGLSLFWDVGDDNLTNRDGQLSHPQSNTNGTGGSQDTNGNFTTFSNGSYTDTLGQTSFSMSGTSPNPVTISYTPPAGSSNPATYTVSFKSYTIKTHFGCSGVAEYGPTNNSLLDRITLPDGTFYQFNYEPTTGFSGDYTGRVASVQLPTGGTISYTYTGSNGGIECADGSAAGLTRVTPDGTWTYTRAIGTGAASTTTMTDPQGNNTVIQFQGIYETQRQVYTGSSTLLETMNTCYNGSASPCTGTAITLPITRRTKTVTLAGGQENKTDVLYNSYGLQTETDNYDYGSGAPGAIISKVLTSYASLGTILDKPASDLPPAFVHAIIRQFAP